MSDDHFVLLARMVVGCVSVVFRDDIAHASIALEGYRLLDEVYVANSISRLTVQQKL